MTTVYDEFDTVWAPPGRAVDESNAEYTSLQTAVDNADDLVLVGPGVYEESVNITTPDLTVLGLESGTIVNGTTDGNGITVSASGVSVSNCSVQSDDAGSDHAIQVLADNVSLTGIKAIDSGSTAIQIGDAATAVANVSVSNCRVKQSSGSCYGESSAANTRISVDQLIAEGAGNFDSSSENSVYSNIQVEQSATHAFSINGNACSFNNLLGKEPNQEGLNLNGNGNHFTNVRVTNSSLGFDIDGHDNVITASTVDTTTSAAGIKFDGNDNVVTACQVLGASGFAVQDVGVENTLANCRLDGGSIASGSATSPNHHDNVVGPRN